MVSYIAVHAQYKNCLEGKGKTLRLLATFHLASPCTPTSQDSPPTLPYPPHQCTCWSSHQGGTNPHHSGIWPLSLVRRVVSHHWRPHCHWTVQLEGHRQLGDLLWSHQRKHVQIKLKLYTCNRTAAVKCPRVRRPPTTATGWGSHFIVSTAREGEHGSTNSSRRCVGHDHTSSSRRWAAYNCIKKEKLQFRIRLRNRLIYLYLQLNFRGSFQHSWQL